MANIVDYVRTANQTFEERPLSRVDSLVLSWLAYVRIPEEVPAACTDEGVTLAQLAQENQVALTAPLHDPEQTQALLAACAVSPRFALVRATRAVDEVSRADEKQFSAITFMLPGEGAYIAFRGTDNTLIGWKENFNMAYQAPVPAQTAARAYLERVAPAAGMPLWVGGHSKGGNLAVYATMTCDALTRLRVEKCFSHDGPGFTEAVTSDASWTGDASLVDRTVPQESLIGLLFENQSSERTVVRSTSPGIMQHAPFSWVVEGNDFAVEKAVSYDSYRTNKRVSAWLRTMTPEQLGTFVEVLYKLVQSTGEVTFSGLSKSLGDGSLQLMLQRLDGLPEADRKLFLDRLDDLVTTLLLGPAPKDPKTAKELLDDATEKVDDITARFNDKMSRWENYLK